MSLILREPAGSLAPPGSLRCAPRPKDPPVAQPRLARLLMLGAATVALVAPTALTAPATAVSAYSSCAEVQFGVPTVADGEYEITVFGQTLDVYCADMATGAPVEYLTLPNTGGAFNFSQGGPGSITSFTKLRLTLPSTAGDTFAVLPTDARFSDNGAQQWGNAGSCGFFRSDANLDLRSTPFAMSTSSFQAVGWIGHSDGVIASSNNQVIDIIDGRGDCGGVQAVSPFPLTWIASVPVASDPAGQTAVSGDDATFTASSTGLPTPTVQWQSSTDGVAWTDVAGATSGTLTVADVTLAESGTLYRAVFTNNQGTDVTAAAELTVTPSAPSTTDPADTTVVSGADATFTVTVGGDPAPTVQWETFVGGVWTAIPGATGAQLLLEDVTTVQDGTLVRVHVQSTAGSAWSSSAELTVDPLAPTASTPDDVTVTSGQDALFSVQVTGDPTPTVQWQVSTDGVVWTDIAGAVAADLELLDVTTSAGGTLYRAVATSSAGTATSAAAALTVQPAPPVVTSAPVTQSVDAGGAATFTVAATGDPAPTFQWQTSTDNLTWTDVAGATGTSFTLDDVTAAQNGLWVRVYIANAGGVVASDGVRLVVVPAASSGAAVIVSTMPVTGAEIGGAVAVSGLLLLTGAAALLTARRRRLA